VSSPVAEDVCFARSRIDAEILRLFRGMPLRVASSSATAEKGGASVRFKAAAPVAGRVYWRGEGESAWRRVDFGELRAEHVVELSAPGERGVPVEYHGLLWNGLGQVVVFADGIRPLRAPAAERMFGDVADAAAAKRRQPDVQRAPRVSPARRVVAQAKPAPAAKSPSGGLDAGLAGRWRFDEGEGTVAGDSSANANHGKVVNPRWADGVRGRCLSFVPDGKLRYVHAPHSDGLGDLSRFTISAWVKLLISPPRNQKTAYSVVNNGVQKPSPHIWYGIFTYNVLAMEVASEDAGRQTFVSTGRRIAWEKDRWYHLAVTLRSDTETGLSRAVFYRDGVTIGEAEHEGVFRIGPGPLRIGGYSGDDPRHVRHFFPGLIDEVRIYNRALSQEQVQALMKSERDG